MVVRLVAVFVSDLGGLIVLRKATPPPGSLKVRRLLGSWFYCVDDFRIHSMAHAGCFVLCSDAYDVVSDR